MLKGKGGMEMEAEAGVTQPRSKPRTSRSDQKPGERHRTSELSVSPEGTNSAHILMLDFQLQNWREPIPGLLRHQGIVVCYSIPRKPSQASRPRPGPGSQRRPLEEGTCDQRPEGCVGVGSREHSRQRGSRCRGPEPEGAGRRDGRGDPQSWCAGGSAEAHGGDRRSMASFREGRDVRRAEAGQISAPWDRALLVPALCAHEMLDKC